MSTATLQKQANIMIRTPKQIKAVIEQAALIRGATLTQFVVSSAYEQAKKVLDEQQVLYLSNQAMEAFINALDAPVRPLTKLRKAIKRINKQ